MIAMATTRPYRIVIFGGDHCGPEVMKEAIKVMETLSEGRPEIRFEFQEQLIGGASIDATGNPLTDEALEACKNADGILLGAVGGPKWGTGSVRPEQGILRLRKELQLFGNLRPCNFVSDTLLKHSPLKPEVAANVDFVIVRELTGGLYFGDRKEDTGDGVAWDVEKYTRDEVVRITRLAANLAIANKGPDGKPAQVTSLDKANVLASSRLWRRTVTEVMKEEFPDVKVLHHLIDSAAMLMVRNPRALNGVVVTSNLFGDIVSDEASVIPGSIGLLPSASLAAVPEVGKNVNGVYEPIHGSAPDIAGQGKVNPIAMILSVAMMLKYSLNLESESKAVETAVKMSIEQGKSTADIGGKSTTSQVGDAIAENLRKILAVR